MVSKRVLRECRRSHNAAGAAQARANSHSRSPCPLGLGQLVGFSPPRFSGPSRRGEGSPAEGRRSRPAAEPRRHAHGPHLLIFPTALQSLLRAAAARPRSCRRKACRNTLTRDGTKVAALDLLRPLNTKISA